MREDHLESEAGLGEPKPVMPARSKYAGQLVDISSRRSIEIRSHGKSEVIIDPADSHVTMNHFYHEGRFWRAVFPLGGVDEIYGQVFNFSQPKTKQGENGPEFVYDKRGLPKRSIPVLNHSQCRFKLKEPHTIDLFPMDEESTGEPAFRLNDFVYSAEAVGPLGITFSFRDGMAGNLVNAHRFLSTREMVFERIVLENQYIAESPPLPVTDPQKRSLLIESILRSHRARMSESYYLFRLFGTNNCTSNPFHTLDRVLDYTFLQRIGAMLYRLPLSPRLYLRVRGLDSDPSIRKLLRHEFEPYIHDLKTQERKRARIENRKRKGRIRQGSE